MAYKWFKKNSLFTRDIERLILEYTCPQNKIPFKVLQKGFRSRKCQGHIGPGLVKGGCKCDNYAIRRSSNHYCYAHKTISYQQDWVWDMCKREIKRHQKRLGVPVGSDSRIIL